MSNTDDTKKMLRAIINGQSGIRSDLSKEISDLKTEMHKRFDKAEKEIKENRKRIDKFGYELAELSDDAPASEDFDELKNKVNVLETAVFA